MDRSGRGGLGITPSPMSHGGQLADRVADASSMQRRPNSQDTVSPRPRNSPPVEQSDPPGPAAGDLPGAARSAPAADPLDRPVSLAPGGRKRRQLYYPAATLGERGDREFDTIPCSAPLGVLCVPLAMTENRRKARRHTVWFAIEVGGGTDRTLAVGNNISQRGLLAVVAASVEEGAAVTVRLQLPGDTVGKRMVQGRIVRVESSSDHSGQRVAVEFDVPLPELEPVLERLAKSA